MLDLEYLILIIAISSNILKNIDAQQNKKRSSNETKSPPFQQAPFYMWDVNAVEYCTICKINYFLVACDMCNYKRQVVN